MIINFENYGYIRGFLISNVSIYAIILSMKIKNNLKIKHNEYTLSEIENNYRKGEFKIPKYQRGYVWDSNKRGMLIDSLLKNYPIGSIIIWYNGGTKYVLDGQQRTRSLTMIRNYPFKDMSFETFCSLFTDKFIEEKEIVLTKILKELGKLDIEHLYKSPYDSTSKDYIKDLVSRDKTTAEILGVNVEKVIEVLNEYVGSLHKGDDIKIPSIDIISADEDDAIEIFDRLNSIGIELTRMEKLAARWSSNVIDLDNENLLSLINNIYLHDGSQEIRDLEVNTPAEIVWAIFNNSFANTKFFKELFTKEEKGTRVLNHSHIDKLLWLIRVMVLKYEKKDITEKTLKDDFVSDTELGAKLKNICDNDVEWLNNAINMMAKSWETLEKQCPILKKEHNDKYIFIASAATNLFVSMATQLFIKFLDNENFEVKNKLQLVMIKETINGSYESSTNKVVKNSIITQEYLNDVSLHDVENKLNEVNNLQKDEINLKNGFKNIAKLVVSIAFSSYSNNRIDDYDFDHVFPKEWLKNKGLSKGQNSIGNCGLLDLSSNRKKRDNVDIDELLNDKLVKLKKIDEAEYKSMINDIVQSRGIDGIENFEDYLDFRFKIIAKLFIENINPISA